MDSGAWRKQTNQNQTNVRSRTNSLGMMINSPGEQDEMPWPGSKDKRPRSPYIVSKDVKISQQDFFFNVVNNSEGTFRNFPHI